MSKTTFIPKITKLVETVIEPAKITIELNHQEAVLLHFVLGRCNSSPLAKLYNDLDDVIKPKDQVRYRGIDCIDLHQFAESIEQIPLDFE